MTRAMLAKNANHLLWAASQIVVSDPHWLDGRDVATSSPQSGLCATLASSPLADWT